MVLIHFASIKEEKFSGVGVVVPQHVKNQQEITDVALVNITNKRIKGVENQYKYSKGFSIDSLPLPFNKPDLVVFHEIYYPPFLRIYKELLKNNIPYIVVPHGGTSIYAQRIKRTKKVFANFLLFNRYINNASAIHYLSKQEMDESIFKNNGFIVPNGIDEFEERNHFFDKSKISFTYIGRIDIYHKGLDLLLSSFESVIKENRFKNFILKIYGPENDDAEKIKEIIKEKKLSGYIKYCGKIEGQEKKKELLKTDFFIQTSRFEGMPMGVLEALSYGIPCCVTKGTNLSEIISKYNAGYYCDNYVEDIIKMINLVLSADYNYIDMEINSKKLIRENYSWSLIREQTLNIYAMYAHRGRDNVK